LRVDGQIEAHRFTLPANGYGGLIVTLGQTYFQGAFSFESALLLG
jgi:hypothetical protein